MKIFVTGGTGYIGSHTVVELINAGHQVVIGDNLCNSKRSVVERLQAIVQQPVLFEQVDVRDRVKLEALFDAHQFDAVIHFAGLKAVGESVQFPLRYYDTNVCGSVVLLETMLKFNVKTVVFSSSATVYGEPATVPMFEDFPLNPESPYGQSKRMVEDILRDLGKSDPSWRIALLRYFNPVGAHSSGTIGEDPNGIPNNLMPFIAQVAAGKRASLSVFGGDYPTPDGTGMRDYIHVVDLALGHVKMLEKLSSVTGVHTYNLGTGQANSVLEMLHAFERASGKTIPYHIAPRRPGDIACYYADSGLAGRELGWHAERGIDQMCADTWRWQQYQEQ
ncbi:MAG: UDP-glucose 4-epimerase GalE [Pseudomonadota bacterium]|jgi:UDP-glucose 4-epimerase